MNIETYLKWLKAAYIYYHGDGEDTGMSDAEWDYWSREFYKNRDSLPIEAYPVIHREEFEGASLFWLKKSDYPNEL